MNEVSVICDRVGIRSKDVIETAATKWNFLKFEPGLVGGHCIGVDPYYLATLAEQQGIHSEVILAGRRINDGMVDHVASQILRIAIQSGLTLDTARIGIFGISFKEDVPDLRNSKTFGFGKGGSKNSASIRWFTILIVLLMTHRQRVYHSRHTRIWIRSM